MERKIELSIDHSVLKYLFEEQSLNAMQTRWLELLNEHTFYIKHIKRREKNEFNTLSKIIHIMHGKTISMCKLDMKTKFGRA